MKRGVNEIALEAFAVATNNSKSETITRLLTEREKIAIGRRLLIAQAILAGKTRFEINQQIGVSPNTFAQINRWLEDEFGEYASAHRTNSRQVSKKHVSKHVRPFSYAHLKRNYPAHFLLFSLVEKLWE